MTPVLCLYSLLQIIPGFLFIYVIAMGSHVFNIPLMRILILLVYEVYFNLNIYVFGKLFTLEIDFQEHYSPIKLYKKCFPVILDCNVTMHTYLSLIIRYYWILEG